MSRHPGRSGRSQQAQALRRRRARRLGWTTAAISAAAKAGGRNTTAGGTNAAPGQAVRGRLGGAGRHLHDRLRQDRDDRLAAGHKTLLWFLATWCPSCQAGTQAMAGQAARLRAAGVQAIEIEDYADLGQPGPPMSSFARQFAGAAYRSPGWTFGTASPALTRAYNPQGYLDVYFLVASSGRIAYINSAPASTMSQLLASAGRLT